MIIWQSHEHHLISTFSKKLSAALRVAQSSRHIVCSGKAEFGAVNTTSSLQLSNPRFVVGSRSYFSMGLTRLRFIVVHVFHVPAGKFLGSHYRGFMLHIGTVVLPDLEISNSHIHTPHLSCWIHPFTEIPNCLRHRADKTWYSQNWKKPWILWGHPGNLKSVQETMRAIYLHLLNLWRWFTSASPGLWSVWHFAHLHHLFC